MLLKSGRVKIITITKPVCSYIAAWSDKRTQYTKKENNSRILEKKKRQKEGKNNSEKRKGGAAKSSDRQSEVVFMFAVNGHCKMLVTGLRKTVLFIQNVQDSYQLCFH